MKAFSLAKYHHVVGTDGRISGNWLVLLPTGDRTDSWVTPIDVTIYDEAHYSGRVIHSDTFTAHVTPDEVSIGRIRPEVRADVAEVRDLLIELLPRVVRAAQEGEGSVIEPDDEIGGRDG